MLVLYVLVGVLDDVAENATREIGRFKARTDEREP